MSSTAAIPPPSSAAVTSPGRTGFARRLPQLTQRARALLTAVNLHYAGVVALSVLLVYLIAHLAYTAQTLHANDAEAQAQQRVTLRAAQIAAQPLRGLDEKLAKSTDQADEFYDSRLPYAYSQVLTELGALTTKNKLRLSRVQYTQALALTGGGALTEVHMDASLSGDYRSLVEFINGLERDKMFFVINGITFTGAQNGAVNLRMRLTTYLRLPVSDEQGDALPASGDTNPATPPPPADGGAQ
jgi:type IV pilus assembly protein PilO